MSLRLQILIIIIVILGLLYILNLIRKNKLDLKYALSWLIVGVFVIILALLPKTIGTISNFLGIADPMNMIFFLGFIFVLIIVLSLTVALSIVSNSAKRLNQKIGMLDKRIRELEEKE
ncbi:MAG: DUF2304 domain-containing protein [Lachnospiraceae bacterium]|nr:DUF2304 domain-containing protein [Lachnospiraceae bacterium]